MWILTSLAKECRALPGSFAEFGVYRAGCAFMVLSTADVPSDKPIYMFDTFAGIPSDGLTQSEVETGLAGALANTSLDYVKQRLAPWLEQLVLVEGDVFETLPATETGPLAFVHMDLNASSPTLHALEYAYPRMEAGAMMVFDDYGEKGLESQRAAVDGFFADKPESVVALPTRQGMLIKR
jgi:O-methyltransferase